MGLAACCIHLIRRGPVQRSQELLLEILHWKRLQYIKVSYILTLSGAIYRIHVQKSTFIKLQQMNGKLDRKKKGMYANLRLENQEKISQNCIVLTKLMTLAIILKKTSLKYRKYLHFLLKNQFSSTTKNSFDDWKMASK